MSLSASKLAFGFNKVLLMQAVRDLFWPMVPFDKITYYDRPNGEDIVFVYRDTNICQELIFRNDTKHDGFLKPICGYVQEICQVDNWKEIVESVSRISKHEVIERALNKCCEEVENTNKCNKNKWFYYNWHPYSKNSKIVPFYTDEGKVDEKPSDNDSSSNEESIEYFLKADKLLMTLECDCRIDGVKTKESLDVFLKMWKDKAYFPNKELSSVNLVPLS